MLAHRLAEVSYLPPASMTHDAKSELSGVPQTRTKAAQRLQFSLSDLVLATFVIAIGCASIRWLGSVWLVPVSLAGLSAVNCALAVRRGSNWRMLKLGHWHFAIWLALAAVATGLAVRGCLDYNVVAGTDKTRAHIVQISAAVLAGPMVGPVANPGAGEYPQAWTWAAILFAVLLLAASPFLFVRRIVHPAVALICWIAFLTATLLWFFGAMISLGVFLS
jgi:hypothetical protein